MNPSEELDFAYKVRHALNDRLDYLPEHVSRHLAKARTIALESKKPETPLRAFVKQNAFAGSVGSFFQDPAFYWVSRLTALLTVCVLVGGLMGIFHMEKQRKLHETAEIDMAVLSDELPPSAYLDNGFKAYLNKTGI